MKVIPAIATFKLMTALHGSHWRKNKEKELFLRKYTLAPFFVLFLNRYISMADVNVGLIGRLHESHARISITHC